MRVGRAVDVRQLIRETVRGLARSSSRATDHHAPSEEFRAGGVGRDMPGDDKYPDGGP